MEYVEGGDLLEFIQVGFAATFLYKLHYNTKNKHLLYVYVVKEKRTVEISVGETDVRRARLGSQVLARSTAGAQRPQVRECAPRRRDARQVGRLRLRSQLW